MPSIDRYFKLPSSLFLSNAHLEYFSHPRSWLMNCIKLPWRTETIRGIAYFPTIKAKRILTICTYFLFSFLCYKEKDDFVLSKTTLSTGTLDPMLTCFLKALLSQLSTLLSLPYYFNYYEIMIFMIKKP